MYTLVTTTSLLTPHERNGKNTNIQKSNCFKTVDNKNTELSILKTERRRLQADMNKLILNARKECVADYDLSHESNKECSLIFDEIHETALGINNFDMIIQELDPNWIRKRY